MKPNVGQWYEVRTSMSHKPDTFEVIATDDESIEVQHFDGTVEEIDMDDWNDYVANNEIKTIDDPGNWDGDEDDV